MSHGAVGTLNYMVGLMPAPKVKKGKKKKKAAAEEPTADGEPGSPEGCKAKKKKKKKAKKSLIPEVPPTRYGPPMTVEQAMNNTTSWYQNNVISQKLSVGVLTTTQHDERA